MLFEPSDKHLMAYSLKLNPGRDYHEVLTVQVNFGVFLSETLK